MALEKLEINVTLSNGKVYNKVLAEEYDFSFEVPDYLGRNEKEPFTFDVMGCLSDMENIVMENAISYPQALNDLRMSIDILMEFAKKKGAKVYADFVCALNWKAWVYMECFEKEHNSEEKYKLFRDISKTYADAWDEWDTTYFDFFDEKSVKYISAIND